ncbi:unnamed protein product [Caenorhabditis angaria]|uniref:Uncharacterized protein n=1 Tax=Caenorhabditis angaria TaxID=860376 RepID=A0A9P1IDC3_9PELO|nr:unnamed protein product [Caenorhabditis angaria]
MVETSPSEETSETQTQQTHAITTNSEIKELLEKCEFGVSREEIQETVQSYTDSFYTQMILEEKVVDLLKDFAAKKQKEKEVEVVETPALIPEVEEKKEEEKEEKEEDLSIFGQINKKIEDADKYLYEKLRGVDRISIGFQRRNNTTSFSFQLTFDTIFKIWFFFLVAYGTWTILANQNFQGRVEARLDEILEATQNICNCEAPNYDTPDSQIPGWF